ncbi:MAG: phosphonate ABC transporter ATP-binding protein [Ignavibacteria bacterium]|nr:phosphonate ABC transporter ATP-binding protein [Ignavibacteria bacterium]
MQSLVSLSGVGHVYPNGFRALSNINLHVHTGEFLVIIGLSGSGKSTLLRCINRLVEPTEGTVSFSGVDVTHTTGDALRMHRSRIGMIFQDFNLIGRHSVLDNVLYGALGRTRSLPSILGQFSAEQRAKAREALEIVGIAEKQKSRADALSGGQQQRVAIARALMQKPKLLLADEPVASLDPATSHGVMKYLERINKEMGTTVICNLHFLSLVRQYASRVVALKAGVIVFDGLPPDITDAWFKQIYGEDAIEVEIR